MDRTVTSVWEAGLRCRVRAGDHEIVVDEPGSVGGTDQGPQPTELFLASVASCFTIAMSFSAAKRGTALDSLAVDATGVYDGPRFTSIRITVRVVGPEGDELERLLTAAKRVCYVTNTLRTAPDIEIVSA